jgi:hypothetical protein
MQQSYTVEYEMTDELAEDTVRAALSDWGHFLRLFALAGGAPFFLALLLLLAILLLFRPHLSPGEALAMLALLGTAAAIIARHNVYRSARWAVLLPYAAGAERTWQVTFSEDGIAMEMGGLGGKQSWRQVTAVEAHPELWLFRLRGYGNLAVPASVLSPELRTFLRRRAQEAGADVGRLPQA